MTVTELHEILHQILDDAPVEVVDFPVTFVDSGMGEVDVTAAHLIQELAPDPKVRIRLI